VEVGAWLRGLGLERYEKAFRDNDIDTEVLPELTGDDLLGLGIASIGHRRKLLAAIAALRVGTSFPEVRPAQTEPSSQSEAAAPRRQLRTTTTAPRSPQDGNVSNRIDDRPQRAPSRGMQLEDDPRAVAPVMNNGRAGVGMRF